MTKQLMTAIALLLLGTASMAQDSKAGLQITPGSETQQRMEESVRHISGTLKETHSILDHQISAVKAAAASATSEEKEALLTNLTLLTNQQGQIEQMLGLVNSSSAEDWAKVQTKAEMLNAEIRESIKQSK